MTVQDVKTIFTRYKKNINDVSNDLFYDWCSEVNLYAYRIMYGEDPGQFLVSNTITITPGVTTYALQTNFLTMEPLGSGLFPVYNGVQDDTPLPRTYLGALTKGYYLDGSNIIFTGLESTTTVVTQRYIPKVATFTSLAGIFVIPDQFIYYVKYAVDVLYDQWDEDGADEGIADQRFIRVLDNLALNLRKDTAAVGVRTFAQAFR